MTKCHMLDLADLRSIPISFKIIAHDPCHGNWLIVVRCILNVLFISDNILSRLLISVQQEPASESEMLVSSG